MSSLPVPDLAVSSVFELTPGLLGRLGVRLLLLDLDNTLSPYGEELPTRELADWVRALLGAGIEPFIVSNNRGNRPRVFAGELGIGFVGRARKPFPAALSRVLKEKGIGKREAALAGDQIFTDVWCAKLAGVLAVAVRPVSLRHPLRALRYALESPFRAAGGAATKAAGE